MSSSIPSRLCHYCKDEKPWIFSGKKLKDGSKVYTNEFAVRWAGRRCPDCERARVHAAVKCDSFERDLIVTQLETSGYTLKSKTLPLIAEKDGREYTVGIREANAEEGQILLNKADKKPYDLTALVFSSVRLVSATQLESLEKKATIYSTKHKRSKPSNSDTFHESRIE